jgi:hypothetical protein
MGGGRGRPRGEARLVGSKRRRTAYFHKIAAAAVARKLTVLCSRLGRCPGRLDQHVARVTAADLPRPRVQPKIAHQLLRL